MKALGPTVNSKVAEHVDEKNWEQMNQGLV